MRSARRDSADDAARHAVLKYAEREPDRDHFLPGAHVTDRAKRQHGLRSRCAVHANNGEIVLREDVSTLPGSVCPVDSRTVTDTLPLITCRFVMTVFDAAKNPLPRPWPTSIDTIAGIERLMMSSRPSPGALDARGALGATAAPGAFGATGAGETGSPAGALGSRGADASGVFGSSGSPGSWSSLAARAGAGSTCAAGMTCNPTSVPAATAATLPRITQGRSDDFRPLSASTMYLLVRRQASKAASAGIQSTWDLAGAARARPVHPPTYRLISLVTFLVNPGKA